MRKLFFTGILSLTILNSFSQINDTGDKVGIGIEIPSEKLDVNGNIKSNGSISINDGLSKGILGNYVGFGKYLWLEDKNANLNVIFRSYGDSYIKGGNLGIGTTSPGKTLDIAKDAGTLRIRNLTSNAYSPSIQISNVAGDQYFWMNYNNNNGNGHIGITTLANGSVEILTLDNRGYLGIGTASPQSMLSVNGIITSKEIKVTLEGWSDFVFNDDYKLKDLEEVESFINENNRLPDIPSESEVVENGVNLGEMDAKLLQKIEELTLYMIEINKEVKSLKQENSDLIKKIEEMQSVQ
jgi:hypothetical protein